MTNRLQKFLTGFAALIMAAFFALALAPAGANPTSGGYQLFEQTAPEHQADIQLASLGNFASSPETASECCNATNTGQYVDILSPQSRQHILHGDGPGSGGHLWPGQPGKTAFPESWSGDKIIHTIGDITTSPNTQWYAQTDRWAINKSWKPSKLGNLGNCRWSEDKSGLSTSFRTSCDRVSRQQSDS